MKNKTFKLTDPAEPHTVVIVTRRLRFGRFLATPERLVALVNEGSAVVASVVSTGLIYRQHTFTFHVSHAILAAEVMMSAAVMLIDDGHTVVDVTMRGVMS